VVVKEYSSASCFSAPFNTNYLLSFVKTLNDTIFPAICNGREREARLQGGDGLPATVAQNECWRPSHVHHRQPDIPNPELLRSFHIDDRDE